MKPIWYRHKQPWVTPDTDALFNLSENLQISKYGDVAIRLHAYEENWHDLIFESQETRDSEFEHMWRMVTR